MCENVLWGHLSAQCLTLEGMDHFPTLEIESESNCVLPWLITGWEDRPSQQHNSIWAKYLYRGGTTSLIHNTFIHIRQSYFQSGARVIRSVWNVTSSCWYLLRQAFRSRFLCYPDNTMSFFIYVFGAVLTLYQIERNPASGEWILFLFTGRTTAKVARS